MINNIIKFLQELGPGFSLVGKEYRLVTPTNKEFFHRYLDIFGDKVLFDFSGVPNCFKNKEL